VLGSYGEQANTYLARSSSVLKKILFSAISFFLGIAIAIIFEKELRQLIQILFKISTNNKIYFVGKDVHLFASTYYYLAPGILGLVLFFASVASTAKQILINIVLTIPIFFAALIMVSYADSNGKIVQCTACNDGKRSLNYNEVNYDGITIISLVLASIPSLIQLIKKRT
jgi:hypothetical protein